MSNPSDSSQGNIKKVLRTAFVGVKPADQVMLKGYLRVLLRLEADLEWVSANNSQVDLFMVSKEFKDAASVVKLLSSLPDIPALYVQRTNVDEGYVNADTVTLPLKQVQQLNDWLVKNLAILGGSAEEGRKAASQQQQNDTTQPAVNKADNKSTIIPQSEETTAAKSAQISTAPKVTQQNDRSITKPSTTSSSFNKPVTKTAVNKPQSNTTSAFNSTNNEKRLFKEDKIANSANALTTKSNQAVPDAFVGADETNVGDNDVDTSIDKTVGKTDFGNLIKIVKLLQQQPDGFYELTVDGQMIATVAPKPALIWPKKMLTLSDFSKIWALVKTDLGKPNTHPHDLKQWLWQQSWHHIEAISPLINEQQTYQLRYWIKPATSDNRRDLLKVMTALEFAPQTIGSAAQIAQVDPKFVKQTIASLLFSGNLQGQMYVKLDENWQQPLAQTQGASDTLSSTQNTEQAKPKNMPDSQTTALQTDSSQIPKRTTLSPLESILAKRRSEDDDSKQTQITAAAKDRQSTTPAVTSDGQQYKQSTPTQSTLAKSTGTTSTPARPASYDGPKTINNTQQAMQEQNQRNVSTKEIKTEKKGFLSRLRAKLGL